MKILIVILLLGVLVSCDSSSGNKKYIPPPAVCPWDSTIFVGNPKCKECIATLTWIAPTHFEDCVPPNFYSYCGKPLPEGYLTRFNAYGHIDKDEPPILEIEIQDPYIVLWMIRDVREDQLYFRMTATGIDSTIDSEEATSDFSEWVTKTCD